MRKWLFACVCAAALLAPTPGALGAPAAEWAGWRGPARDGKSPETGLLKEWPANGPALLWKATGIGAGFSTVAVSGGMVYTTGLVAAPAPTAPAAPAQFPNPGAPATAGVEMLRVFAFDANGKPAWSADHGPQKNPWPGSRATPVVDEDSLYLMSSAGLLVCYNARTGERRWTRNVVADFAGKPGNWGYAESVLVYENLAIVTPGGTNTIVALNKKTGETAWTSKGADMPAGYGSCIAVTFAGVPMIIAGTNGGILAVSPKDGAVLWQNDFCAKNTANIPTPAYADGYVFWANGYRKGGICLKLSAEGGAVTATEAWRTLDMDCQIGGYVILDGHVYGNHQRGWTCFDLKTGDKKWFTDGVGKGSVCYADGMFYLFSEDRGVAGLAALSPNGLEMKGQFSVEGKAKSWAYPVVTGSRLYLRYDDNLYCFDVKTK